MKHLTMRVAWHDNGWDGTICREPSRNSFCLSLDRIRENRDDRRENELAGSLWNQLDQNDLPPCVAESGAFMNPRDFLRVFKHPYQDNEKTRETHGHLKPTLVTLPAYSAFAVPFWWTLIKNQDQIDESLPTPLPADEPLPTGFKTDWVFGRERQRKILELVFGQLEDGRSLVFFYSKGGHPAGEGIARLVVGIGTILKIGKPIQYEHDSGKHSTYLVWDRIIQHSIRPDGSEGLLLPYHQYIEPTGDIDEDMRRHELLQDITIAVPSEHIRSFSYASELVGWDVALSTLSRCLQSVRQIKRHGIAKGPWDKREDWLNKQIAAVWQDRGAFPGLGSVLEAIGLRLGTSLFMELHSSGKISPNDDPWPIVDAILAGSEPPPARAYVHDIVAVSKTWANLSEPRRNLLKLLSRFEITPKQAERWFTQMFRPVGGKVLIQDSDILANPYLISEWDDGVPDDPAISIGTIDRGLLPDTSVRARNPVPEPSTVHSYQDVRRLRAALTSVLRAASEEGDTLLSEFDAIERLKKLDLSYPCDITPDTLEANESFLSPLVARASILTQPEKEHSVIALQLVELREREDRLRKVLHARAKSCLESTGADWNHHLIEAIRETGGYCDIDNPRHYAALREQVCALEAITTRKLSLLVGKAGTGKTSVLGALVRCTPIAKDGILLLAPTGKARVRMGRAANFEAMTIAQFLYSLERYDPLRQRPLFSGPAKHHRERTVVVDECSMVTMDDLAALFEALDLGHVQRIILVGDPNQLPPIGLGRPFADLCAHLEEAGSALDEEAKAVSGALAKLSVELRSTKGSPSDTLKLASWFTSGAQPVDADHVLSDLEIGASFNDLSVVFWNTPEELRQLLLAQFQEHLGLSSPNDKEGFNLALGIAANGHVDFNNPDGVENFQLLSPVKMHSHGVYDLNRFIQRQFRHTELENGRKPWGLKLGEEEIVRLDKVIQLRNQWRDAFSHKSNSRDTLPLANGEIALITHRGKNSQGKPTGYLNAMFAGRPGWTIGYSEKDFPMGEGHIALAYTLTIHKAQGSEFKKVFIILPKNCRLLSRELLYTALTRSREQLVLLIEGNDISSLYEYSKPEHSETAKRNTNLFRGAVRTTVEPIPHAYHLIHLADKGHMVRSKSELVIANMLYSEDIDYQYERRLEGKDPPGVLRPDFTFVDPSGELVLWEHLGMMTRDDYRRGWEWKHEWYRNNDFVEGRNLFTTEDDEKGGLSSADIRKTIEAIKPLL